MQNFRERGLVLPTLIGVGFLVMVIWNLVFVYLAVQNAPEIEADYLEAIER